jgi:hypothetical protein
MENLQEQILPFTPSEVDNTEGGVVPELGAQEHEINAANGDEDVGSQTLSKLRQSKQAAIFAPPPHQSSVWSIDGHTFINPPDRLANFYRKYNKILLDNVAIAKEKERLQLENLQLQDLIQQYISGTQLGNDVLSEDNPLFVVNGRFIQKLILNL